MGSSSLTRLTLGPLHWEHPVLVTDYQGGPHVVLLNAGIPQVLSFSLRLDFRYGPKWAVVVGQSLSHV